MEKKQSFYTQNIRREANDDLKVNWKKKFPEDENSNFEKNIQNITDEFINKIEKIIEDKEKEILQIWIKSTMLHLSWMEMEDGG